MANRHALVVDDSKTARVTLQRMLEKQGLDADTLGSARETLDYLLEKTPDVIFMDHMMPGMDGFQAVEAIKGNPDTATIPIMMYTSKGGDLYVSQARALGAVGILPKQVQPAELFEVLKNLGLVKDRRAKTKPDNSRFVPLDATPEIAAQADREDMQEIARQAAESASNNKELHGYFTELLENHHNALGQEVRDLRHSVEQLSGALTGDTATSAAAVLTPRGSGLFIPLMVLLVMLIPLLWLYNLHHESRLELDNASNEVARLQAIQQEQEEMASEETATLRAQLDTQNNRASEQSSLLHKSIAWAVNLGSTYDVREEAFSDRRLAVVYELVSRLQALGFKGVVRLESHLGEFCLSGNDVDGYSLAAADLPVRDCAMYGHPLQQLPSLGERQSIGFANFIATSPLVNDSDISIEIIPHQYSQPRLEYPSRDSDITAYEWNRIAADNNRVEVDLIPAEQ